MSVFRVFRENGSFFDIEGYNFEIEEGSKAIWINRLATDEEIDEGVVNDDGTIGVARINADFSIVTLSALKN
jgi:hypothetical protein